MIQDIPPAPAVACVQQAEQASTLISVGGPSERVAAFLKTAQRNPQWKREGEAGDADFQLVVFRVPGELPYREIGGLIFEAQRLKLAVVVTSGAPLCSDKEE